MTFFHFSSCLSRWTMVLFEVFKDATVGQSFLKTDFLFAYFFTKKPQSINGWLDQPITDGVYIHLHSTGGFWKYLLFSQQLLLGWWSLLTNVFDLIRITGIYRHECSFLIWLLSGGFCKHICYLKIVVQKTDIQSSASCSLPSAFFD